MATWISTAPNLDGSDVKRLTSAPGYDGGAFFSWDGKKIVWRAPDRDRVDAEAFRGLLARELVQPRQLEIWIMDADGSNKKMITKNGAANFAPFWHPDGKHIIFASNMEDPRSGQLRTLLDRYGHAGARARHPLRTQASGASALRRLRWLPPCLRAMARRSCGVATATTSIANETNVFVADWVDPSAE